MGVCCVTGRFVIASLGRVDGAMYELLVLLSIFLVFASLVSLVEGIVQWRANAGKSGSFWLFPRREPLKEDDRVLPLEQVVQQALAKRRILEAR